MNVKASFGAEARQEFLRAVRWYAMEAGATHASRFEEEVRTAVARLSENPNLGAETTYGLRRYSLHRYPYTLFYRAEPQMLRIIAVAHQSRHPDYWSERR